MLEFNNRRYARNESLSVYIKNFGQTLAEQVQPNNLTFVLDLSTCSQWSN